MCYRMLLKMQSTHLERQSTRMRLSRLDKIPSPRAWEHKVPAPRHHLERRRRRTMSDNTHPLQQTKQWHNHRKRSQ
jgi:hypothetical protein